MTDGVSTDRDLMQRVAKGDERALRRLYEKYEPMLRAVAWRILREQADTEDAVASTFAQVWKQADRYREQRGSVAAWLTMMVRSRAVDAVRARTRQERTRDEAAMSNPEDTPGFGQTAPDTNRLAEDQERRGHVRAALMALTDDQRQVIELAFFGGQSHSEIATVLNTPLGTVKTRIRSAMQVLRERLRPLYAEHMR